MYIILLWHYQSQSATNLWRSNKKLWIQMILFFSIAYWVANLGTNLEILIWFQKYNKLRRLNKICRIMKNRENKIMGIKVRRIVVKRFKKRWLVWNIKIILGILKIISFVLSAAKLGIIELYVHKLQLVFTAYVRTMKHKTAHKRKYVIVALVLDI